MRATTATGRQLEVLFFALCGLFFWVFVVGLLWLLGGMLFAGRLHAQASGAGHGGAPAAVQGRTPPSTPETVSTPPSAGAAGRTSAPRG